MRIFSREPQAANLGLFFLVATDLIDAGNKDEVKFYNEEVRKVIIPNSGKQALKAAKNEGKATVKTNVAKVTLPVPGQAEVSKFIGLARQGRCSMV